MGFPHGLGVLAPHGGSVESAVSAVSWAAIIAGALAIAAASLILLALGSGLAQEEERWICVLLP
jgi:hypothetical protein